MAIKNKGIILIVDDEPHMGSTLREFFEQEGYSVKTTTDPYSALVILKEIPVDVVLGDLRMPKMDGLELLREIKKLSPDTEFVLMTAYATVDNAVEAMHQGAYHYITKPFHLEEISIVVAKAMERKRLFRRTRELEEEVEKKYSFDKLIGKSQGLLKVFDLIKKVADTDSTILITGESGTGKELVAKSIHYHSLRKDKPFVAINCGGIPGELLESELFGHEKGAFTGAVSRKQGLFEMAVDGTLFLDEVGELPQLLQVKILRALQESEIRRVGGLETLKISSRVIAATNKNLYEAVKKKEFREDLYFRLNVIPIHLPPLRERTEDIPLLVETFIKQIVDKKKLPRNPVLNPETMKILLDYRWPGNIRELENLMEQLLILVDREEIMPEDLPDKFKDGTRHTTRRFMKYQDAKESFEKEYFVQLLNRYKWNITRAADEANMSRRNLHEKIRNLDIIAPWEQVISDERHLSDDRHTSDERHSSDDKHSSDDRHPAEHTHLDKDKPTNEK